MGIICRQGFIYLSVDAEAPKPEAIRVIRLLPMTPQDWRKVAQTDNKVVLKTLTFKRQNVTFISHLLKLCLKSKLYAL